MEAETLALAQEIDFSFWALFARASLTVKIVIAILVFASFWAWSIIVQRIIIYRHARRQARRFDRLFWSACVLVSFTMAAYMSARAHQEGNTCYMTFPA